MWTLILHQHGYDKRSQRDDAFDVCIPRFCADIRVVVVAEVKRYVREHDRLFANSKVTYIRKSFEKCLVLRMFGEGFVGEHQRLFARIPS